MTTTTLRLDGTPCECGRPTGQCVKGDMERCPLPDDENEYDDELSAEDAAAENCGRWRNGTLSNQCLMAGTEECDWECPIGLPHRRGNGGRFR